MRTGSPTAARCAADNTGEALATWQAAGAARCAAMCAGPPADDDGPPADDDGPPANEDAPPADEDGPPEDAPPAEDDPAASIFGSVGASRGTAAAVCATTGDTFPATGCDTSSKPELELPTAPFWFPVRRTTSPASGLALAKPGLTRRTTNPASGLALAKPGLTRRTTNPASGLALAKPGLTRRTTNPASGLALAAAAAASRSLRPSTTLRSAPAKLSLSVVVLLSFRIMLAPVAWMTGCHPVSMTLLRPSGCAAVVLAAKPAAADASVSTALDAPCSTALAAVGADAAGASCATGRETLDTVGVRCATMCDGPVGASPATGCGTFSVAVCIGLGQWGGIMSMSLG